MPTAEDYDRWARWFDEEADAVVVLTPPLVRQAADEVVSGGRLAAVIDVAVRAADRNVTTIADHLRHQAATCRSRAAICRSYAADLAAYAADVATGTHRRLPPSPPASWVEVPTRRNGPR